MSSVQARQQMSLWYMNGDYWFAVQAYKQQKKIESALSVVTVPEK